MTHAVMHTGQHRNRNQLNRSIASLIKQKHIKIFNLKDTGCSTFLYFCNIANETSLGFVQLHYWSHFWRHGFKICETGMCYRFLTLCRLTDVSINWKMTDTSIVFNCSLNIFCLLTMGMRSSKHCQRMIRVSQCYFISGCDKTLRLWEAT